MPQKVDLQDTPVLDAHCFTFDDSPLSREDLTQKFWLAGVELRDAQGGAFGRRDVSYLEHSVAFKEFVMGMSAFLSCAPSADEIIRARAERMKDFKGYVKALAEDAGIKVLVVDNGLQTMSYVDEFAASYPAAIRKTFRFETLIRDLLNTERSFDALVSAYDRGVEDAVWVHGCVSFKSVIAYRTGLNIQKVSEGEASRDFDSRADRITWFGPHVKKLRDFLLRRAIIRTVDLEVPVLIHTGIGDTDIVAPECSPILLASLLQDEEVLPARVVLIHGGWPYTYEAGWLANVMPNVYLELSADQPPFMRPSMTPQRYGDLLKMVPIPKLVYGSDGQDTPEPHWYYAKYAKRAMAGALDGLVEEGIYTVDEAQKEGENIFYNNGIALFGLEGAV